MGEHSGRERRDKSGPTRVKFEKEGKKIKGIWQKDSRTGRTIIKDASGNQIKLDRGLIWFEILPTEGVLTVK